MHLNRSSFTLTFVVLVNLLFSMADGQTDTPWVRTDLQKQVPLSEKLKFEPNREWIQKYFSSRETMAEETARLFRQLGSADYRLRLEAQRKISALPFVPRTLIEKNLKARNPEIRFFIKSVARKRFDTERMYLHLTIWTISRKEFKGFAKQLLRISTLDDPSFRRYMIPVSVAASVVPEDFAELRKVIEKPTADKETASENNITEASRLAAIWGLTVLEKKHSKPAVEEKYFQLNLETRLARGLALLYCNDANGMKVLLPLLDCPDEKIRVQAERALRAATGKWFGHVGSNDSRQRENAIKGWTGFVDASENVAIMKVDPVSLRPELRLLGNSLLGFRSLDDRPGLLEVSPTGMVIYSYGDFPCYWAHKLSNGNMLATVRADTIPQVAEIGADGKIVWSYPAASILKCRLKPNGNILICFQEEKKLIEVNRDKEIVWGMRVGEKVNDVTIQPDGLLFIATDAGVIRVDKSGNDQNIFDAVDITGIELLPDGDLLLASWRGGKIIQISQTGEKRWEFSLANVVHATRTIGGGYLAAGAGGFWQYDAKRKLKKKHAGFNARFFAR